MHHQMEPARTPASGDHSVEERREASVRSARMAQRYAAVERVLEKSEPYEDVVFLNELLPENKQQRYVFGHELQLPFAVELYSYQQGGNAHTLWWIWRAPPDPADSQPQQTGRITNKLNQSIPVFYTRAMRKAFIQRYQLLSKVSPSLFQQMFRDITGDSSTPPTQISKEVQA